jgi:hypothetical protein
MHPVASRGILTLSLLCLDDGLTPIRAALGTNMMGHDGFMALGTKRCVGHFDMIMRSPHVSS